jgi:stringent starvation protein B
MDVKQIVDKILEELETTSVELKRDDIEKFVKEEIKNVSSGAEVSFIPGISDGIVYQQSKMKIIEEMMEDGKVALIINAADDDVVVPDDLKQYNDVILNFSHDFVHPPYIDSMKISQILSFDGNDFSVVIPARSIWSVMYPGAIGDMVLFQRDIPVIENSWVDMVRTNNNKNKVDRKHLSVVRKKGD